MEYGWEFSQKSICSNDEKRQCLKLVSDLVALAKRARRNGLLSLVQAAEESPSFLLRKGLQLVVDGVNPQIVRSVLEAYILSGQYRGRELLERCIILEGVTAIQKGLHPKVTKELLLSLLGENIYEIFEREIGPADKDTLETFLESIKNTPATTRTDSTLDRLILKLEKNAIEKFLMEINTGDLAKAIKGMGGRAQIRIFNHLPQKAANALREKLEDLDSIEASELAEAQKIVLEIISDLKEQGAIEIPDELILRPASESGLGRKHPGIVYRPQGGGSLRTGCIRYCKIGGNWYS